MKNTKITLTQALISSCPRTIHLIEALISSSRRTARSPFSLSLSPFLSVTHTHTCVSDDYKVVRIGQFAAENQFYLVVLVYSMKTDSWTRIPDVPGNICIMLEPGRFASGVLYWSAMKYQVDFRGSIVGFDLGLGKFTEVPWPDVGKVFFLVSLGESLCVFDKYSDSRMDVWLMNSCGMENTWYRAFSVELPGALGTSKFVKPVAFSGSGGDVLLEVDHSKLVWYDLEKNAAKNVRIRGIPNKFESYAYTESLLQLTEGKQLHKPSQDKKEKKQQKKRMLLHKLDRFRRLLGLDLMHLLIVLASLKQCQGHCLPLDQEERFAWWEWVMVVSHSPQMEVDMFGVLAARTHGLRASNILLEKD